MEALLYVKPILINLDCTLAALFCLFAFFFLTPTRITPSSELCYTLLFSSCLLQTQNPELGAAW